MKLLFLKDILAPIHGQVVHGSENLLIENVATKPYELRDHTLLFDLDKKGKVDLQHFQCYRSCVVVVDKCFDLTSLKQNLTVVKVESVHSAYWRFIRYYRRLFHIPVIGVTGTCGKTTTKEMIRHILKERYQVQSTYLSSNAIDSNLSYLLGIDDHTQAAVFEMGVSSPGDLKLSSQYFQPDIGIMTTIGIDHLAGCKTEEVYIKAKTEIIEGMPPTGTLILNADNENIMKLDLHAFQGNIVYFGLNERSPFRASNVRYADAGMEFTLHYRDQTEKLYIPGYGEHNVYNALSAIAAVCTAGISIKEAGKRLRSFRHVERHLQVYSGIKGCTVIDDTWSSNPTSLEAALKVLMNVARGRKAIAVIGKMSLLGKSTRKLHAIVGGKVVDAGIDILVTIGDEAKETGIEALELGMNANNIFFCGSGSQFKQILSGIVDKGSVVLLKTSSEDAYLGSLCRS